MLLADLPATEVIYCLAMVAVECVIATVDQAVIDDANESRIVEILLGR